MNNVHNLEIKKPFEDKKYGFENAGQVLEQLHVQKSQYNPELQEETEKFLVSVKEIATQFALAGDPDGKTAVQEINEFLTKLRGEKEATGSRTISA